jgi:D-3-phosphoglycerate dehydrogenase
MSGNRLKVVRVEKKEQKPLSLADITVESEVLNRIGAEVIDIECNSEDEIIQAAKDADAVLVIFAPMTRRVLSALPRVKVLVRYGIGYDTVDVDAATDNGILVVNIPDFCLREVSDHALALTMTISRQIVTMNSKTKKGNWTEAQLVLTKLPPPYQQTIGFVGCGNIGQMTARKAKCFGFRTIGYDPYISASVASDAGIELVELSTLLKESDYVSVHALLNQETRHLIGEKELKQMKPTAHLINTARGGVIDEGALIQALSEKWIAGAGLDVFEQEPIAPDNPLLRMDNVIITPHCAGSSEASVERLKLSVAQEAARVLTGRWPKNVVNKSVTPKGNLEKEA